MRIAELLTENAFGVDPKIKGKIMNIASDLSDVPGMWDHQAQTFTDQGREELSRALGGNDRYVQLALKLNSSDFEAEGSDQTVDEGPASRALCTSGKPDSALGASNLASCKSQGYRAREGGKSHKIGDSRTKVRGQKIKGKKYGGPLPDWSGKKK